MRERSEWSGGPSDIERKTTRVGASECGQRTSFNRTREAGHLDEIQGVVANTLQLPRNGAACRVSIFTLVGFIGWLDVWDLCVSARVSDRNLNLLSCARNKSPFRKAINSRLIKQRLPGGLDHLCAGDGAIRSQMQNANTSSSEMLSTRFIGKARLRSVNNDCLGWPCPRRVGGLGLRGLSSQRGEDRDVEDRAQHLTRPS